MKKLLFILSFMPLLAYSAQEDKKELVGMRYNPKSELLQQIMAKRSAEHDMRTRHNIPAYIPFAGNKQLEVNWSQLCNLALLAAGAVYLQVEAVRPTLAESSYIENKLLEQKELQEQNRDNCMRTFVRVPSDCDPETRYAHADHCIQIWNSGLSNGKDAGQLIKERDLSSVLAHSKKWLIIPLLVTARIGYSYWKGEQKWPFRLIDAKETPEAQATD